MSHILKIPYFGHVSDTTNTAPHSNVISIFHLPLFNQGIRSVILDILKSHIAKTWEKIKITCTSGVELGGSAL